MQAQERGEIRSDLSADTILGILYGHSISGCSLGSGPVDSQFVDAIFHITESGVGQASK